MKTVLTAIGMLLAANAIAQDAATEGDTFEPEWDLICEKDHGCDPVPLTPETILELQQTDPHCAVTDAAE